MRPAKTMHHANENPRPRQLANQHQKGTRMNIRHVVSLTIVAAMVTIAAPASAQSPSTTDQVKTWSLKKWNEVIAA